MSFAKRILAIISMFMMLASAFGCGSSQSISEKPLKILHVGTNMDFMPFEFKTEENPEVQGFDIDLMKALAAKMNYRVEFSDYLFEQLIPALNGKEVDVIISAITINDERKMKVSFSEPYFKSGLAIVVAEDSDIKSVADLEGKKICARRSTTGAIAAKGIKNSQVLEFDTLNESFAMVKDGGAVAFINDRPVIEYLFLTGQKNIFPLVKSVDGLKIFDENLTQEEYGVAVRTDDKELLQKIDAALQELKQSGEYQKIYDKWFAASK